MDEAVRRVMDAISRRATTSARSPCSRPRSRTPSRATSTSRPSAGRWSSRSWSRSSDGQQAAPHDEPPAHDELDDDASDRDAQTRRRKSASWTDAITPDVVRSIMGTVLMALGAIALIALLLPGQGKPHRHVAGRGRAMVPDRALAAAVPAARRRVVRRRGSGQAPELGVGDDPRRADAGVRLGTGGVRGPRYQALRPRARRRDHRPVPREHPRTAAHGAGRVHPARRADDRRADARLQPAAARDLPPGHGHRPMGRRDRRDLDASRAGTGRRQPAKTAKPPPNRSRPASRSPPSR